MARRISLLVVALMALGLVVGGCRDEPAPTEAPRPAKDPVKKSASTKVDSPYDDEGALKAVEAVEAFGAPVPRATYTDYATATDAVLTSKARHEDVVAFYKRELGDAYTVKIRPGSAVFRNGNGSMIAILKSRRPGSPSDIVYIAKGSDVGKAPPRMDEGRPPAPATPKFASNSRSDAAEAAAKPAPSAPPRGNYDRRVEGRPDGTKVVVLSPREEVKAASQATPGRAGGETWGGQPTTGFPTTPMHLPKRAASGRVILY